jgi:hypothetical protein
MKRNKGKSASLALFSSLTSNENSEESKNVNSLESENVNSKELKNENSLESENVNSKELKNENSLESENVNSEELTVKRSYTLRRTTIKKLQELKVFYYEDPNITYNEIVDEAIQSLYKNLIVKDDKDKE